MTQIILPRIKSGQRAIMSGRTGTGKSVWANWMMQRSPGSWVIVNPKHTAAYSQLPDAFSLGTFDAKKVERALRDYKYVIINPDSRSADSELMDTFVLWLHESWSNVGLCCDELYTLHNRGIAGPGLIGWLTRGRELKQSFLGLTQRPAWVSQFLFSESDYIGSMSLALEKDRKRLVEMTGRNQFESKLAPHDWLWYNVPADTLKYYGPVPLPGQ